MRVIQYCLIFPRYTAPIGIMKPIRTNKGIPEGLIYSALVQLNHLAFMLLNVFTNFKVFRICLFFNLYSKRSLECFKLLLFKIISLIKHYTWVSFQTWVGRGGAFLYLCFGKLQRAGSNPQSNHYLFILTERGLS